MLYFYKIKKFLRILQIYKVLNKTKDLDFTVVKKIFLGFLLNYIVSF